ncbi:peptidase family C50-domain-containing protein [Kalaharituber pfeilii]|nr:peptidase family C50-domain-containing protein [Kalaharituber pfeilii]
MATFKLLSASAPVSLSPVETIIQALSSIETCTSSTLSLLNAILFPAPSKHNGRAPAARTAAKTAKKKPAPTSTVPEAEKQLTTLERYRLATEVVNSTLKTLNSASKEAQGHGQPKRVDTVQVEVRVTKSAKSGTQPLKIKSLNRTTTSSNSQHPAIWTAECSCLAINYIYTAQQCGDLPTPLTPLQIEAAQHNLIIRLIVLKMYDIALRELTVLKKRVEGFIAAEPRTGIESLVTIETGEKENQKPVTATKGGQGKSLNLKEEGLASMLIFKTIPQSPAAVELVVGLQMSIIRCIVGMGKQVAIESLIPTLYAPYSTLALLKNLPNSFSKLSALDSLIFSCCPSTSSSADATAKNISSPSPKAVLQLQEYALEAKALTKTKRADELWEQLSKCIAAFCRRYAPKEGGKERYKLVREMVLRFQKALSGELPEDILQMLATTAQESGFGTEALKWIEQANTLLEQKANATGTELNDAAKVCRLVKIAALSLKTYAATLTTGLASMAITAESVKDITIKLNSALQGVDSVSRVRMEDLEKLLQEVALFRRAATVVAITLIPAEAQESSDLVAARQELKEICTKVSDMAIKFFRKYISIQPSHVTRVKRFTSPAVDFITLQIRQEAVTGGETLKENWDRWDSILLACLDLAKTLEQQEKETKMETDNEPAKDDEDRNKESEFERISAAYWKIACSFRKIEAQKESLKAMKRSANVLIGRPKEETIRGGLVSKIERLGNGLYQLGEAALAEEAFTEGVKALVNEGIADEILHLADNKCLSEIFGEGRAGVMLGRTLDGVVKCVLKNAKKRQIKDILWDRIPFDDVTLNRETRGLILEWQLRGLCGLGLKESENIKAVAGRLLELYTEEEPLRRARVISRILKLQVDNPTFMDNKNALELGEEVETLGPLHRDAYLKPRREDIVSSCLVSYAFLNYQNSEPRPDILQTALLSWRATIERCNEWDRLLERIEDPEELMSQLYMLIDFFEMKGLSFHRITALRSLILIKGLEIQIDFNSLVKLHSLLGIQYLRMGYSGKAGMVLVKAQSWLIKEGVLDETKVQWHLAYTEYLIAIGNMERAQVHYDEATKVVNGDTSIFTSGKTASKLERRVMLNRTIADASYVMSLLCFELGNPNDSLSHVRRCIRLNQRSWAVLEQLCKDAMMVTSKDSYPKLVPNAANSELQKLIEGVDQLSVSHPNLVQLPVQSMTLAALNAPLLWTLVTSMYMCLVQASLIYRHQGMVREAMFSMEQALKIVEAVGATPLIAQALSIFGDLKIRAGSLNEGADMLEKATELRAEIEKSKEIVTLDCSVGYFHGKQKLWEEELGAYEHAEAKLEALMSPCFIKNIDILQLAGDPQQPEKKTSRSLKKDSLGHARTKSGGTAKTVVTAMANTEKEIITECSSLLRMRGNILRLKAYNLAMQSQCEQADLLLQEAGKLPSGKHEIIYQRLAQARHLLLEGLELLSSDPVYCVLQDSTISLPSVAQSKTVTNQEPTGSPRKRITKRALGSTKSKEALAEQSVATKFVEKLSQARDIIADIHLHAAKVGSTAMAHSVSMLLSGIIVLLSAVLSEKGTGVSNPILASYSLELNKGLALLREKDAIEVEKATNGTDNLNWPELTPPVGGSFSPVSTPFTLSSFQKDYIDIIPQGWAAVSISLSEVQDELYLSRFQTGQSQLMLRLPLTRHNSRDDAEEIFEFETGMEALKEILEQANISTHAAKEATAGGKASKTEWWAEREKLDAQLGELLANIEHCWLGGFKGIFGQYPKHPELLRRFRSTFEKILAKHLPSRQSRRAGKKGGASGEPVKIDPRVLDLFVAIGDPAEAKRAGDNEDDSENDLESPLQDLLWFVFDILQFHGERNAYDEIDIDAMVVDVTEALRSYHQGIRYSAKSECEETKHTILILDKNVHMIPWESLPCLDGHAVSRLPSMAALRHILVSNQMDYDQARPGVYVDGEKGTWVLNPSGDLISTQSTFERELQTLPESWTGISSRTPTETEFAHALGSTDIFLYFGHGSGAQFIRARTVKKLDKCGVAMLMGCSSGALKDAGEFQPYGMPLAYLLGGSAGVVANLWDVTDRDIDRFSKRVLEDWGLLRLGAGTAAAAKGKSRSRSKSRERPKGTQVDDDGGLFGVPGVVSAGGKGKVSLVEAVAQGRKECHLKYLNGAAPVVYGVPVYLG